MLEGTDTAERLIWLVNPYSSSLGKVLVATYTSSTSLMLFLHISKSLKLFILVAGL
jgi:hypothetical protein